MLMERKWLSKKWGAIFLFFLYIERVATIGQGISFNMIAIGTAGWDP